LSSPVLEAEWGLPEKLSFLLEPHRYKVAYGGRDGGKSWTFARVLLGLGVEKPLRIGCFREVQKSIQASVYQLMCDQIEQMKLGWFYEPTKADITGKNGTKIVFHGLSNETRESIKSFEGLDIAWVEEAHAVSKRSWDILIPTIRGESSEIWVSFNPNMDTDDTYQRFVVHPPPESKVVKINYTDNPWKSKVLDAERERMQREAPDDFAHIYEGHCRPAVEGAIYFKEVSELRSSQRLCNVPYDPMLKVHVVVDLGFNDFMSLILVQRLGSEIRIIRYIEDRMRYIASYHQELKDLKLNYGTIYLPHDARAKHVTGSSAEEQFRQLGWTVSIVENIGIEQGIRKAREVFPRLVIDKTNASELVNRLGRYRRRVNADGQASTPVHDDESHGADGFRYMAIVADQMSNENILIKDPYKGFRRYG
jgi:phage terminase large subunit